MITDDLERISELRKEIEGFEMDISDAKAFKDDAEGEMRILERRVSTASILPPAEVERLMRPAS